MKRKYLITSIGLLAVVLFVLLWYFSSWGFLLGKVCKNYYYSKDGKNCITIMVYTAGDGLNILKDCIDIVKKEFNYDTPLRDDGRGIYIIPGKFTGRLPKDNYVRLDYIGGLPTNTFYFRWDNDSLTIRLTNWIGVIMENKLDPCVKIDSVGILDYERGWSFEDSVKNKKMKDEWDNMRKKYQYVVRKDLKVY